MKFKFKRVVMTLHNDRFLVQKRLVCCGNEHFLIFLIVNDKFLAVKTSSFLKVPVVYDRKL